MRKFNKNITFFDLIPPTKWLVYGYIEKSYPLFQVLKTFFNSFYLFEIPLLFLNLKFKFF